METDAYKNLVEHGVKASVQRIAIMDYLQQHMTHPTVDEIYRALVDSIPTLSKATVYNTLRLFMAHGLAQMLTIDERNACFDINMQPHAHFFCTQCGRVTDLPLRSSLPEAVECPEGARIETVSLYLRGVCAACRHS